MVQCQSQAATLINIDSGLILIPWKLGLEMECYLNWEKTFSIAWVIETFVMPLWQFNMILFNESPWPIYSQ